MRPLAILLVFVFLALGDALTLSNEAQSTRWFGKDKGKNQRKSNSNKYSKKQKKQHEKKKHDHHNYHEHEHHGDHKHEESAHTKHLRQIIYDDQDHEDHRQYHSHGHEYLHDKLMRDLRDVVDRDLD